ncbi:MAG: NADH dehydrogenase/NADH:ubiquinone oxidoreductase subunit G [Rhodothermales bacterium]|jgi:NADH dehydrogenase/NADH:ubiquinone oxidoreductase subunit G
MARAVSTILLLGMLGSAGWAMLLRQQLLESQDKQQLMASQLADKAAEVTQAFGENRRLAMAQAGALSELEDAQTRIRELETEVETVKDELAEIPVPAKKRTHGFNWHAENHEERIRDLKEKMQIKFDGNLLVAGEAKPAELDELKTFLAKKELPLDEEQEKSLAALYEAEPAAETQTITQTDDGNGFTIVMTEIGGTDDARNERIREGAKEILTPEQQSLLEAWHKRRGKREFRSTQSFQINTK